MCVGTDILIKHWLTLVTIQSHSSLPWLVLVLELGGLGLRLTREWRGDLRAEYEEEAMKTSPVDLPWGWRLRMYFPGSRLVVQS